MGRLYTGYTTQEHAVAALRLFEVMGPRLNRHPSRHFAHRCEQGQSPFRAGNGLVGNGSSARSQQQFGLLGVGCEMQVSEQQLSRTQHVTLIGLRLLDLNHHVGACKNLLGTGNDMGARRLVIGITETNARAPVVLHPYLMAMTDQLTDPGRGHADAVLVVLNFPRNAHQHNETPLIPANSSRPRSNLMSEVYALFIAVFSIFFHFL